MLLWTFYFLGWWALVSKFPLNPDFQDPHPSTCHPPATLKCRPHTHTPNVERPPPLPASLEKKHELRPPFGPLTTPFLKLRKVGEIHDRPKFNFKAGKFPRGFPWDNWYVYQPFFTFRRPKCSTQKKHANFTLNFYT